MGREDGVRYSWVEKDEVIHARVGMDGVDYDYVGNVLCHPYSEADRHRGIVFLHMK